MKMNVKKITESFLDELNFDYETIDDQIYLQLNAKYEDNEDSLKINIVFDLESKLRIVKINFPLDVFYKTNEGFFAELNKINNALEIGYLVGLKIKNEPNNVGLIYRHDISLWSSKKLMEPTQFKFLVSYLDFVKSLIDENLEIYMVRKDE